MPKMNSWLRHWYSFLFFVSAMSQHDNAHTIFIHRAWLSSVITNNVHRLMSSTYFYCHAASNSSHLRLNPQNGKDSHFGKFSLWPVEVPWFDRTENPTKFESSRHLLATKVMSRSSQCSNFNTTLWTLHSITWYCSYIISGFSICSWEQK